MQLNYRIFSALLPLISCVIANDYYSDYDNYNERQTTEDYVCTKEGYHEDSRDCKVFWRCVDWGDKRPMTPFRQECGEGTVFSKIKGNICTYPWDSGRPECNGSDNNIDSNLNQNQNARPQLPDCTQEGWIADPDDCMRMYRCEDLGYGNYKRHPFTCGAGTVWDPEEETCNHPWDVNRPECRQEGSNGVPPASSHPGSLGQPDYPDYQDMSEENQSLLPNGQIPSGSPGGSNLGQQGTDSNATPSPGQGSPAPTSQGSPASPGQSSAALPPQGSSGLSESGNLPASSGTATPSGDPNNAPSSTPNASQPSVPSGDLSPPNAPSTPSPTYLPGETATSSRPSVPGRPGSSPIDTPDSNDIASNQGTLKPGFGPSGSSAPPSDTRPPISSDQMRPGNAPGLATSTSQCTEEGFFPNEKNCRKFIRCVGDASTGFRRFDFDCGPGTAWDQALQTCNHAHLVESCKGQTPPGTSQPSQPSGEQQPGQTQTGGQPSEPRPTQKPGESSPPKDSTSRPTQTSSPNQPMVEIPSDTSEESKPDCDKPSKPINYTYTCEEEGFKAVPEDCQKFYRCVYNGNGFNVYHFECSTGTIFDPSINVCNYPESVYPPRDCSSSSGGIQMPATTAPPSSEEEVTEMADTTTDKPEEMTVASSESTTVESESTTVSSSASTETESTSEENSTTEAGSTTEESSTTESSSTTEESSTTESGSTMEESSTTESGSTTEESSTTEASSMTEEGATTEAGSSTEESATTEAGSTTEEGSTTESASATEAESTTESGSTTEASTMESSETTTEASTTEENTTEAESTSEATTESASSESTTESSESTTSAGETTTSAPETSSPLIPPGSFPCPVPNLSGDQFVLACPSGFRRYPKYCNLFYQCTTSDAMEVKILVFSCPKDTIFDEKKIQCIPEEESDQPCEGFESKPSRVYRAAPNLPTTSIEVSSLPLCPGEGHFPYKIGCSNTFYKCTKGYNDLIQGYLYKCPEDFVYWSVSRRCERIHRLPMCNYVGTRNVTETFKNKILSNLPTEYHNISARKNRRI